MHHPLIALDAPAHIRPLNSCTPTCLLGPLLAIESVEVRINQRALLVYTHNHSRTQRMTHFTIIT